MRTVLLPALLVLLAALLFGWSLWQGSSPAVGRYQISTVGGVVVRLDTRTGELAAVELRQGFEGWSFKPVAAFTGTR